MVLFCKRKILHIDVRFLYSMVSRWRFELQTLWLKVKCSTDWASGTKEWLPWMDSNHRNVRVKVWCLTTWLRGNQMVGGHGFEPWNPKEQIYSLPRLTTSLSLQKNGAGNRTWTHNLLITSQLLYQLSYSGKKNGGRYRTRTYDPLLVRQVL